MKRITMLASVLLCAGVVAAVAPSAPQRTTLSCALSSTNDIVCRVAAKLWVAGSLVTNNSPHIIAGGTNATTSPLGTTTSLGKADLYFKKILDSNKKVLKSAAICQMRPPAPKGTSLKTRAPYASSLFTQYRGRTVCTFTDGTVVTVTGSGGAFAYRGGALAEAPFSAFVWSSSPTGGITQLRIVYEPSVSFAVAVRSGRAMVRLSDDEVFRLSPGVELTVTLGAGDTIVSAKLGKAAFSADENAVWASQLKKMG